ncbi:MAG TPA: STAS domain-containing protein [Solirubrobacteraceae bacterium]|jgi:anti-anti-sigma factor|nr:STAS domain-containing protein [Solirubrobacteraceae bacterium]
MERHQMTMAGSVCTRSEDDALASVASQTRTAFNDNQSPQVALGKASLLPTSVRLRMHTLVLTGSLDRSSVHELEKEIECLCEEGVTGITLDLRGLTYIDVIGVAVIAFRCGLYERRGYEFALIAGSRVIQRAFEHAGVSELLPFREPEEDEATAEQPTLPAPPLVLSRLETVGSAGLN